MRSVSVETRCSPCSSVSSSTRVPCSGNDTRRSNGLLRATHQISRLRQSDANRLRSQLCVRRRRLMASRRDVEIGKMAETDSAKLSSPDRHWPHNSLFCRGMQTIELANRSVTPIARMIGLPKLLNAMSRRYDRPQSGRLACGIQRQAAFHSSRPIVQKPRLCPPDPR